MTEQKIIERITQLQKQIDELKQQLRTKHKQRMINQTRELTRLRVRRFREKRLRVELRRDHN